MFANTETTCCMHAPDVLDGKEALSPQCRNVHVSHPWQLQLYLISSFGCSPGSPCQLTCPVATIAHCGMAVTEVLDITCHSARWSADIWTWCL